MKKLFMTGVITLFVSSILLGCGDTAPQNEEERNYLDESEVEVEVFE